MKLLETIWNVLGKVGTLAALIGLMYQMYKDKRSIFKLEINIMKEYLFSDIIPLYFLVTIRNTGNRTIQLNRVGYRKSKSDKRIFEGFFVGEDEIIKPNEIKSYKLDIRSEDIRNGKVKYISAKDTEGRIYDFRISRIRKKSN